MDFDRERFDVNHSSDNLFLQLMKKDHLARYSYVRKYLVDMNSKNIKIIDVASGLGYGCEFLSGFGHYTGIDRSQKAVSISKERYPQCNFVLGDAHSPSVFREISLADVIVSFETIEHLKYPSLFLKNCYSSLKEGGLLFFSAPVVLSRDWDEFHLHDKTAQEWQALAEKAGFRIIRKLSGGFDTSFEKFRNSNTGGFSHNLRVISFVAFHPSYWLDRVINWGFKGIFQWKSVLYVCEK